MKLGHWFRLPHEIFLEDMPDSPRRVIIYLFSLSLYGGECSPGYAAIERHTFLKENAIRSAIAWLQKKHWISHTIRGQSGKNMRIYIRIPPRLQSTKASNVIDGEAQFKVV